MGQAREGARLSDVAALLAGVGAMLSAFAAIATLFVTVKRGSDRENKQAATVAIAQDETDTPIERGGNA